MISGPRPQIAATGARPARSSQPQVAKIYKEIIILTDVDILQAGLHYAGFDTRHQGKVNLNRNMARYKQFYGVDPSTAAPLFRDLRNKFPSFMYKDGLMAMNWLFLNDKQSVLSGRWGPCEEYIGKTVKRYATMIQSLKQKKIKFRFGHNKRIKASIDCSTFVTNEFRQDPSGKWFNHKSIVCLSSVFHELFLSAPCLCNQLCCISKRNTKAVLISMKVGLYHYGDPLKQECMT